MMSGVTCSQFASSKANKLQQTTIINLAWIFLYTETTASTFKTARLLDIIRACVKDERLHMLTNGGS